MNEQAFIEIIKQWISIPYLLTFVFLSYGFFKKTKIKQLILNFFKWEVVISKTWIVLIFAFLIAIPFYFLLEGEKNVVLMKLIISYSLGTSFYELIIRRIDKLVSKER